MPEITGNRDGSGSDMSGNDCICQRKWPSTILSLAVLALGIAGLVSACILVERYYLKFKHHYGVVLDAGSSHTEITVYKWPSNIRDHGTAKVTQVTSVTCSEIGISSLKGNSEGAGKIIRGCIENIAVKVVPKRDLNRTPVFLGATAGMRLLCIRNRKECTNILNSVKEAMKGYKFQQDENSVKILTGAEEGTLGWITVNILTGALEAHREASNNTELTGALDMGGASLEITFIPKKYEEIPPDNRVMFRLYGENYTLYTHSFPCYGMKEAERRFVAHLVETNKFAVNVTNPCFPSGYAANFTNEYLWLAPCSPIPKSIIFPINNKTVYNVSGNSSYTECRRHIDLLFNETECQYGTCSFNGVYQPALRGKFMAFSGFGYTGAFLNLSKSDSIEKLGVQVEKLCKENWKQIQDGHKSSSKEYLPKQCFHGEYSYRVLTHGFHFRNKSKDVKFVTKVKGTDVGWSLGFMVNATNLIPLEKPTKVLTQQEFIAVMVASSLLSLIGLILLVLCFVKRRLNSQSQYMRIQHEE